MTVTVKKLSHMPGGKMHKQYLEQIQAIVKRLSNIDVDKVESNASHLYKAIKDLKRAESTLNWKREEK